MEVFVTLLNSQGEEEFTIFSNVSTLATYIQESGNVGSICKIEYMNKTGRN